MRCKWTVLILIIGFLLLGKVDSFAAAEQNSDQASQATIEAREKFFGKENVNPTSGNVRKDKVILSWFGVSNYAAAINGHVILLDAWVPRGTFSGYVPTTPDELAQLMPEAVFIGHAHFDHAADAAEIITKSGAALVGTPEHCDYVKSQLKEDTQISCIQAVPKESSIGTTADLSILEGVKITAVKQLHSELEHPDSSDPHKPLLPAPDISNVVKHPAKPGELSNFLRSALTDEEGGVLLYQFQVGEFSLIWNDSSGPLKEEAPELLEVFNSLPKTDVQVGAIMGYNQYTNGLRDPRMYIEAIKPKVFIPSHHDNWAPPITTKAVNYFEPLTEELMRIPTENSPELQFIKDPEDYIQPEKLTFDINDWKWN